MKIIIQSASANNKPYTHLEPIVLALLKAGNQLSDPIPGFHPEGIGFYQDKDGWKCDLKKSIDFDLIEQQFELPKSIQLSKSNNSIFCQNSWVEVRGNIA